MKEIKDIIAKTAKTDKVRVIVDINRQKVYVNTSYVIPIRMENGQFITGQDLPMSKIVTGKGKDNLEVTPEPLTEEEYKKYPFVIDPTNAYKVKHLQWLNKKDPMDAALIKLLILSTKWAESKLQFDENPVIYDGYLQDTISEAVSKNAMEDLRYEAETEVRKCGIDDYRRIALVFSFKVPGAFINLNESTEVIKGQLIELCKSNPKEMRQCFEKYNPGIDNDIFILECIDSEIVQRDGKGNLYYHKDYIGTSIEDVKQYLNKQGNQRLSAVFQSELEKKHGKAKTSMMNDKVSSKGNVKTSIDYIMECKAAIFDGNYEAANKALSKIDNVEYSTEFDNLSEQVDVLKEKHNGNKNVAEIEKFKKEMEAAPIDVIQKKIEHIKSNYKKEDCIAIWDDKAKLIEYMVTVKFKQ